MNALSHRVRAAVVAAIVIVMAVPEADAKGRSKPHGGGAKPHRAAPQHHTNPTPKPKPQRQAISRQSASKPRPNMTRQAKPKGTANPQRRTAGTTPRRHSTRRRVYTHSNRQVVNHQNNRAMVARLNSARAALSRLTPSYQGHRVQAIHAITKAMRHLGNRSTSLAASSRGVTNRLGAVRRAGTGNTHPMSQAQAAARVRKSMHSLQAVHSQLTSYGYSPSHSRAKASVGQAIRHLSIALKVS